jgi:hypothetical protein
MKICPKAKTCTIEPDCSHKIPHKHNDYCGCSAGCVTCVEAPKHKTLKKALAGLDRLCSDFCDEWGKTCPDKMPDNDCEIPLLRQEIEQKV